MELHLDGHLMRASQRTRDYGSQTNTFCLTITMKLILSTHNARRSYRTWVASVGFLSLCNYSFRFQQHTMLSRRGGASSYALWKVIQIGNAVFLLKKGDSEKPGQFTGSAMRSLGSCLAK